MMLPSVVTRNPVRVRAVRRGVAVCKITFVACETYMVHEMRYMADIVFRSIRCVALQAGVLFSFHPRSGIEIASNEKRQMCLTHRTV